MVAHLVMNIIVQLAMRPNKVAPYMLRTIEDIYGLRPYLGGSATAKDITNIWQ